MTDNLLEVEKLLTQLSNALGNIKLDGAAKKAADRLESAPKHADKLSSYVQTIDALGQFRTNAIKVALDNAATEAKEVGNALKRASDAVGVENAAEEFTSTFIPSIIKLDVAFKDCWRTVVRQQFDPLLDTGTLLEIIPKTKALGAELKATAEKANELLDRHVDAEKLPGQVTGLMTKRKELTAKVRSASGGQPEVDEFLQALTQKNATLRHMSKGVLKWLSENDALDAFSVTASP
jgi:hypothetical protein